VHSVREWQIFDFSLINQLNNFLYSNAKRVLQKEITDNLQRDGIEIIFVSPTSPIGVKNRSNRLIAGDTDSERQSYVTLPFTKISSG